MEGLSQFCKQRCFHIPVNQRGFAWGEHNVRDLIADLKLAGSRNRNHYMGPLIVTKQRDSDFTEDDQEINMRYTLEDGQQRLTSFFLLMRAAQERILEVDEGNPSLQTDGLNKLLFYTAGNQEHLRIKNENAELDACLNHCIHGSPPYPANETAPMKAMKKAAEAARKEFQRKSRDECVTWMNRLTIQAKFILVDLETAKVDRYLTFDAINSRGLPLSQFDKIKNFCILLDSVRGLDSAPETRWYQALQELEKHSVGSRANEEAFVAEMFNVFHNTKVTQGSTHQKFVEMYRSLLDQSNTVKEQELESFIKIWPQYARSFGLLASPRKSRYYGTACTKNAGKWLDRLDNMDLPTITRPILVAAHMCWTDADFEDFVRFCEIYTFRVNAVMPHRTSKNAGGILSLANNILKNAKDSAHSTAQFCDWLTEMAPLSEVLNRLANGDPKYNHDPSAKGWAQCYYFLYEYELSLSPRGVSPLPYALDKEMKKNSQEHILPQQHRDNGWWASHWPDEGAAEKYKHRLGNLSLTGGNSILGRKPIDKKISDPAAEYSYSCDKATNTEKRIPSYTKANATWGENEILRRELDMLRFAAARWSIPCCADNGIVYLPDTFQNVGETQLVVDQANCKQGLNEISQSATEDAIDDEDD